RPADGGRRKSWCAQDLDAAGSRSRAAARAGADRGSDGGAERAARRGDVGDARRLRVREAAGREAMRRPVNARSADAATRTQRAAEDAKEEHGEHGGGTAGE